MSHRRGSAGYRLLAGALFLSFLLVGFRMGYGVHSVLGSNGLFNGLNLGLPALFQDGSWLPRWGGQERVNILVLGLDRRPDEGEAVRADAIMLVSLDPMAKRAVVISLPRDLWVAIPGYGENRINMAYFYGEVDGQGGPTLLEKTIEANFKLPIHHSAVLNFQGFVKIVDLLGGVTIDVPTPIQDGMFPNDNYGYESLYIPAGEQNMDGEMLLKYVRTRHGGSDFDRMRRQQQALFALGKKAISLDLMVKAPQILSTLDGAFSTDLKPLDILALAGLGWEIGLGGLEMQAIDESLATPFTTWDGAEVLLPDKTGIAAMLEGIFSPTPQVGSYQVLVLNGTLRAGLAREVAGWLRLRGYSADSGNADRFDYPEATIISMEGAEQAARHLSALLEIDPSRLTLVPQGDGAEIVLVLGADFSLP